MKNIIHILYFLTFLIIASPVFGEPTKLLGITTEEYGDQDQAGHYEPRHDIVNLIMPLFM